VKNESELYEASALGRWRKQWQKPKSPDGRHGFVWRIVLDPRSPDGFAQVHAAYDLDDVAHAMTLHRTARRA